MGRSKGSGVVHLQNFTVFTQRFPLPKSVIPDEIADIPLLRIHRPRSTAAIRSRASRCDTLALPLFFAFDEPI